MATDTRKRRRRPPRPAEELAHLKAQNVRLRARLRALTAEKAKLRVGRERADTLPALPPPDADGNYPAAEALDVLLARQIIRRRQAAGWTQAELARRAGVRQETVSRIESGKHAPTVATVDKLDRALREGGA
jgi:DNA-binding XRE family transcriptional regulator